jgi:hypothetical protein
MVVLTIVSIPCQLSTAALRFLTFPLLDDSTAVYHGWYYPDGELHKAVDYKAAAGTDVLAAADGVAIGSCQPPVDRQTSTKDTYGQFVLINHQNGFSTLYAHLESYSLSADAILPCDDQSRHSIKSGDIEYRGITYQWAAVKRGDVIGKIGKTGTTYTHLHFEMADNSTGSYDTHVTHKIDPYGVFGWSASFYPPPASRCAGIEAGAGYHWTACPPQLKTTNVPPLAGFTMTAGSQSATDGQTLNLTVQGGAASSVTLSAVGRSSDPDGSVVAWEWTFDGVRQNGSTATLTSSFGVGTHIITLIVTDNQGARSQPVSGTIVVSTFTLTARDDTYVMTQGTILTVPPPGVLANDTIPSGTFVSVDFQTVPPGTFADLTNGGFLYTPDPSFVGVVTFRYLIHSTGGDSNTATVTVQVNSGGSQARLTWVERVASLRPVVRESHAIAYDAAHAQTVLFGGLSGGEGALRLNDTWIWDGANWIQKFPALSPPGRFDHAMAFDAVHQEVVLFGGHVGAIPTVPTDDTWVWNGSTWTQRFPTTRPPPRSGHAMVYDAARHETVLFGGYDGTVGLMYDDTWVWDGTNWTQRFPLNRPQARQFVGMAFDSARNEVVLFGGGGNDVPNDTWIWTGSNWVEKFPSASPPARLAPAMAAGAGGEIVLFGGWAQDNTPYGMYLGDTWTWDGTNWTQRLPATSPAPCTFAAATYDAARNRVVLFGGAKNAPTFAVLNDTWEWRPSTGPVRRTIGMPSR